MEQLDKGLIDFGLVFGGVDSARYQSIELPFQDVWGVLMRKDSPLAKKTVIEPEDLWDKPLIISEQSARDGITDWMKRDLEDLEIIATYNLLFNASLMVEEGLGYAIGLDKIIHTSPEGALCFRPLNPEKREGMHIIWKKYQVFSKVSEKFIERMMKLLI